jgi:hypothetical protein
MHLPSAEQYLQIVKEKPLGGLATLHSHRFIVNEGGEPWYSKGNYAIVFKTEQNSKNFAIRFFLDSEPEVFERYKQIQAFLNTKALYWKIPFQFLDKEVHVDGEYYPAVKMDWIDSLSLTEYLNSIVTQPALLTKLQQELVALSQNLEKTGIGHGNLNMDHIRFVKQGQTHALKLIDYDSMFIPAFKGKDSVSPGTAGFQHPMRLASDFSETIDRFSFWVFITALEAFKKDPGLWKNAKQNGFDKEEHILFTYRDLAFPQQSNAFQLLKQQRSEALNFYTSRLIAFCNTTSLTNIEAPKLFGKDSFHPATTSESIYMPQEEDDPLVEEVELLPVDLAPEKPVVYSERSIRPLEKKSTVVTRLEIPIEEEEHDLYIPAAKKKKRPIIPIVLVALLLLSLAVYFVKKEQSYTNKSMTFADQLSTPAPPVQKEPEKQQVIKEKTIFTSANVTQFLFQLYQSYNKRDLSDILSNYADSLNQYYDVSGVTKRNLRGIISDLFIKPAYYECHPDLRTLQLNRQENFWTLTISINETIKKDGRSNTENYSSKIEYTIDSSFKILSEKNLD